MSASPAVPAAAVCAAVCAALLLLVLHRILLRTPPPPPSSVEKSALPSPACSDVEKDKAPRVDDVWPRHALPSPDETPAPSLGSSLPDVALVWGVDYSQPPMSAVDRQPLMAYSHIASALGVDEPEPVLTRTRSESATASSTSPTDTRPMRSRSLISGIVSDWNSLSQSEQQAWATLSEARASRTRSGNSRDHGSSSPRAFS
ncbi:hypothetical protein RhiJN_11388 [Ceratobasidium sp. AG-Ba]|nr:hypothetical protein RhiJN_11388 [Ceratobasidium sp. AG-Ba]